MIIETDIGIVTLGFQKGKLICEFGSHAVEKEPAKKLAKQLIDYFSGNMRRPFATPIPDGPVFSRKCWEACRKISYGKTISYKELATMAGSPKAARAAGQAMRNNPVVILTPCHRVLSSTGKLHGFAGTTSNDSKELKRKQYLLNHEKRYTNEP